MRFLTACTFVASAIVALYTVLTGPPTDPALMDLTPAQSNTQTEGTLTLDGHTYDYGISAVPLPPEYSIDETEPLTPQH